jgi:phosphoribosyl 1,2-cyclic phosphodiesterase
MIRPVPLLMLADFAALLLRRLLATDGIPSKEVRAIGNIRLATRKSDHWEGAVEVATRPRVARLRIPKKLL